MSWVREGECHFFVMHHMITVVSIVTDGKHKVVPQEIFQ